jgi:hypothetical protein
MLAHTAAKAHTLAYVRFPCHMRQILHAPYTPPKIQAQHAYKVWGAWSCEFLKSREPIYIKGLPRHIDDCKNEKSVKIPLFAGFDQIFLISRTFLWKWSFIQTTKKIRMVWKKLNNI